MSEKCYVCGSNQTERVTLDTCENNHERDIIICQSCGHAQSCDQVEQQDNAIAQGQYFDRAYKNPRIKLPWYSRHKVIVSEINKLTSQRGKVLDIGCGNGQWLVAVGNEGTKHGIEVSESAAEKARISGANIFNGTFEDYDAEPESFDIITAFSLIEHLKDPRTLIQWVFKHLKPGGLFVVLTGDRQSKAAQKSGQKWPLYVTPMHLHFFSANSLDLLIAEAGFVIKKHQWFYCFYKKYEKKSWPRLLYWKAKELLRIADSPDYDHLFIYAQKPQDKGLVTNSS